MRICGISIDISALPTKEEFIKLALVSRELANYDKVEAITIINKTLKVNGLYQPSAEKPKSKPARTSNPVSKGNNISGKRDSGVNKG